MQCSLVEELLALLLHHITQLTDLDVFEPELLSQCFYDLLLLNQGGLHLILDQLKLVTVLGLKELKLCFSLVLRLLLLFSESSALFFLVIDSLPHLLLKVDP
jgi:hypothetical protein